MKILEFLKSAILGRGQDSRIPSRLDLEIQRISYELQCLREIRTELRAIRREIDELYLKETEGPVNY